MIGAWSVFAMASTSPDSRHYTRSYESEQKNRTKYNQDAVIDFTKKFNTVLKKYPELKEFSDSCGGCDVVLPEFDEYLKNNLPILDTDDTTEKIIAKLRGKNYASVILWKYAHENVSKAVKDQQYNALNTFVAKKLTEIVQEAGYQSRFHHQMTSSAEYTDGDLSNSSFDIIDDVQKIMKLLFDDPAQYDGYVNTMRNDASGLITGRFQVGEWAQWKSYEIDLASDVSSAFWQEQGGGSGSGDSGDDCEDGFCITVDLISNDSYSWGDRGTAFINTNFEEIFGSGLDWLVKKGDKRNTACKAPPPVNHFQSNNDQNLSFTNIFRGLGIFVFQKTPKYAKTDTGSQKKQTEKEMEKEMDDVIKSSFKNRNIDLDHLLLNNKQQMIEKATPVASKAWDTAENQDTALRRGQTNTMQAVADTEQKRDMNLNQDEGIKNTFRSLGSWTSSLYTTIKDTFDIMKWWLSKPDCKN